MGTFQRDGRQSPPGSPDPTAFLAMLRFFARYMAAYQASGVSKFGIPFTDGTLHVITSKISKDFLLTPAWEFMLHLEAPLRRRDAALGGYALVSGCLCFSCDPGGYS
jgi:hypothetical protein